jgi:hypothetical protein
VEGRRGGLCHLLNVSVQGTWQACPWAIRSFIAEPILVETMSQASHLSGHYENDKILPLRNTEFTDSPSRKKSVQPGAA